MKKIIIVFFLLWNVAYGQIYLPSTPAGYGENVNRLKPLEVLHIPSYTGDLTLHTTDESAQIRLNDGVLQFWDGSNWHSAAGGKFGVEDNLATDDRDFNLDTHRFHFRNASEVSISAGDDDFVLQASEIYTDANNAVLYSQVETGNRWNEMYVANTSIGMQSRNDIGEVDLKIDANDNGILPKLQLTGVPTGAGYVLTDVAGDGNLSLQPSTGSRFGLEDNTNIDGAERSFDFTHHSMIWSNLSDFTATATDGFDKDNTLEVSFSSAALIASGASAHDAVYNRIGSVTALPTGEVDIVATNELDNTRGLYILPASIQYKVDGDDLQYLPLTVNGVHADATGDVTISSGGSETLQQAFDQDPTAFPSIDVGANTFSIAAGTFPDDMAMSISNEQINLSGSSSTDGSVEVVIDHRFYTQSNGVSDGSYGLLATENFGINMQTDDGTNTHTYSLQLSKDDGFNFANSAFAGRYVFPTTLPTADNQVMVATDAGGGDWRMSWATPSGGSSSRFGVSGEDDIASADRGFDLNSHGLDISGASSIQLFSHDNLAEVQIFNGGNMDILGIGGGLISNSGGIKLSSLHGGTPGRIFGKLNDLDDDYVSDFSIADLAGALSGYFSSGGVTSVTGTSPIHSSGGTTPAITIDNAAADGSTKGAATFTANDFNSSTGNISLDYTNAQAADATHKGFLTSTDWGTFNGKQAALGFTAENVSNKTATASTSTTTYPNWIGVENYVASNPSSFLTSSSIANLVDKTISNTYTAGARQIFVSDATNSGFNLAGVTSNPSSLSGGDMWYRSDDGTMHYYDAFAATARTFVNLQGTQTLTNKTLTTPVIASIVNTGTQTVPTVTGTLTSYVQNSISSSSTPSPTGDSKINEYYITALAATATFAAPSGTPANGNELYISILDNNTPQNLNWNAIYSASTDLPLPAVTLASKIMIEKFRYNSTRSKWILVALLNNIP